MKETKDKNKENKQKELENEIYFLKNNLKNSINDYYRLNRRVNISKEILDLWNKGVLGSSTAMDYLYNAMYGSNGTFENVLKLIEEDPLKPIEKED